MKASPFRVIAACLAIATTGAGFYFLHVVQTVNKRMDARTAEIEQRAAALAAKENSSTAEGFISLDEIYANVGAIDHSSHTVGMKLDLELFGEDDRTLFEQRQAGVKDTIIGASLEQKYDQLVTVAGKLYFKELLVARLNTYFNRAVVRDIHFSSFYLQ